MDEQTESVIETLDRRRAEIDKQSRWIYEATEIMNDAAAHLCRKHMGQDNNELAARMYEWLGENDG
jgi:hypothetical protein